MNGAARRMMIYRAAELEKQVAVSHHAGRDHLAVDLLLDGHSVHARGRLLPDGQLRAELDGRHINATVIASGERRHVFYHGVGYLLTAVDPLFHVGEGAGVGGLTAPMPGKVIALVAKVGERVAQGAPLLILEAMKMEHTIAAPTTGLLKAFRFAVGEQVADGDELVEFEVAES